jgi:hypothetical protein
VAACLNSVEKRTFSSLCLESNRGHPADRSTDWAVPTSVVITGAILICRTAVSSTDSQHLPSSNHRGGVSFGAAPPPPPPIKKQRSFPKLRHDKTKLPATVNKTVISIVIQKSRVKETEIWIWRYPITGLAVLQQAWSYKIDNIANACSSQSYLHCYITCLGAWWSRYEQKSSRNEFLFNKKPRTAWFACAVAPALRPSCRVSVRYTY